MAASLIIDSVRSALADLALLDEQALLQLNEFSTKKLKYSLKNLHVFLLCARKLDNDMELRFYNDYRSLGSLLERIAVVVDKNVLRIRPYYLGLEGGSDFLVQIIDFESEIQSFDTEIDRWYTTLDFLLSPMFPTIDEAPETIRFPDLPLRPIFPVPDEVTEIIDSVVEILVVYLSSKFQYAEHSPEAVEALLEKLTFLRNFVRFVTLKSVENLQLQNFWAHIRAVAVNAAHLSYMAQCDFNQQEWSKRMQKIRGIDPHLHEAYVEALACSKLSTQSLSRNLEMDRDPMIVMKDFIDFLLWNLWEMLKMDSIPLIDLKDRLQLIYEGLKFLRTTLQKQQDKFDEDIRVVLCDAGIIIFSLHQKDETVVSLSYLLVRMKLIRKEVEAKDPDSSIFYFPRTRELGCLYTLLENLEKLSSWRTSSPVQSRFHWNHDRLLSLISFLGTTAQVRSEQEELPDLWNCVMEAAHRVKYLLDQSMRRDFRGSSSTSFDSKAEDITSKTEILRMLHSMANDIIDKIETGILMKQFRDGDFRGSFSTLVDSIAEDNIRKIETAALSIGRGQDIKVEKVSKTYNLVPSQGNGPTADEIVGFDDDATSIIHRLKRGSNQLKIVAIVGMPGIGKTTLATKVYDDPSLAFHFHLRIRCSVSQLFDRKKMLLELFNNIDPSGNLDMDEQDLAENLRRRLKEKRYLILLDDVWDIKAWDCLQGSFPDDSRGSRILLTSRHRDAAPQAKLDEEPHFLRQLTKEESFELLQRKLFPRTCWAPAFYELGKQIAENCGGLPLTVVVVAGVLATLKLEGWKNVLESLSSGFISSTEQCMNTVEMSYRHLPEYLKPCFLYFGLFPEDQEVSVQRLIWLWIAEGFVHKTELKCLEDVASDCMMDLVGRSLVMVSKKRSRGGIKACRVHDLLHDFCRTKAREENFFQLLKGYDELLSFDEPSYLRRLSIHSQKKHFKNLRLFSPCVHSLLFFIHNEPWSIRGHDISFIIPIYKDLRVLDIGQFNLGSGFPIEMRCLVYLRYLAVKGDIGDIPSSSIESLSELETLFVESTKTVSLPDTIWDLHNLRHLHIPNGFHILSENLDSSLVLCELESCSGAIIYSWGSMEKQLRRFPNIRKLKCISFQLWDPKNCNMILVPDFLGRLESFDLTPSFSAVCNVVPSHFQYEFGFPENLKKLTLNYFKLSESQISTIGELPNLEVLKLLDGSFNGDNWAMVEGEFSKLKFLQLSYWSIVRWTAASDDQFPCLEKLVLEGCRRLKKIPTCLENIPTLEMIEVRGCSGYVANAVKIIQDAQKEIGNSALKILISHHSSESSW